jgi:hypothetical protein
MRNRKILASVPKIIRHIDVRKITIIWATIVAGTVHAADDPATIVGAITDGLASNYAGLGPVKVEIKTTIENPNVKTDRRTTVNKQPNGPHSLEIVEERITESREVVQLDGETVRYEYYDKDNELREIITRADGRWQIYHPGGHRLEIAKSDNLPDKLPIDPREFASLDIKETLVEYLRRSKITASETMTTKNGRQVAKINIKSNLRQNLPTEVVFEFDIQNYFLPISRVRLVDDQIVSSQQLEYQKVPGKDTLFLKASTETVYSVDLENKTAKPKVDQIIRRQIDKLEIEPEQSHQVISRIDVPVGTSVYDHTKVDTKGRGDNRTNGMLVFIVANVVLIAAAISAVIIRNRRNRTAD